MERFDPMNFLTFLLLLFPGAGRWTIDKHSKADGKELLACTNLAVALSTQAKTRAKCAGDNFQGTLSLDQTLFGSVLAWPEVYNHLPNVREQLSSFQEHKFLKICFSTKPPPWKQAELILSPECFQHLTTSILPFGHWNFKKIPLEQVPKTITSSSPPGLLPALCPCSHHFWVDGQRGWKMMATECHHFGGNTQPSILSVWDVTMPQSLPEIGLVKSNHPNLRTGSTSECGPGAV